MAKLSISRQVLPALAIACIVSSAAIIAETQPDREAGPVTERPPQAPVDQRNGSVAGAGLVEPASELIAISPAVPGVVERVHVAVGDRVVAGQPLFTVDSRDARAAVAEAAARLARLERTAAVATSVAATARERLALYREAGDPRVLARQDVIDREGAVREAAARLAVARAEVAEARAQLATAQTGLARLTVRAPRAAEVLQVRTRAGQYAPAPGGGTAADALMTLGETRPLHVRVDIDETEIGRTAIGQPATIYARGAPSRRITARFVRAEPLVVPKRSLTNAAGERVDIRVLQLVYALPEHGHGLFVGQQVDAFVPARASQVPVSGAAR
ncbi:HlyD family secretion protein [Novosphingobium piscinae]|uniref:Efflux RND transporter periplasmic adaptor subunit n=1 Tax=Novosphingobium piscinae TaxID=1507448 RepID=A0A7X1FVR2_9SPHN|nr:efflux RND transporter periplasmic adaptor subunit [Novosphingobium piscinae]MBC2667868.1 efflux RND transporter periplasmic adaptor subunit [Novosphingobium piscinae]